jgi:hypothetical protein
MKAEVDLQRQNIHLHLLARTAGDSARQIRFDHRCQRGLRPWHGRPLSTLQLTTNSPEDGK